MISLTWVQRLLVLSMLAAAIYPRFGLFAFGASWALLAVGTVQRTSKARKLLAENPDALGANFPPETKAHLQKYPLTYVWPELAEKWGTTWQMGGLLCIILGLALAAWALFSLSLWPLFMLPVLFVALLVSGTIARNIKISERVKDDLKELKGTHEALMLVVRMKSGAGQWPPQPPPEGG
ncbi:MAG: hypothetical protein QM817_25870 [Archangium sp.]